MANHSSLIHSQMPMASAGRHKVMLPPAQPGGEKEPALTGRPGAEFFHITVWQHSRAQDGTPFFKDTRTHLQKLKLRKDDFAQPPAPRMPRLKKRSDFSHGHDNHDRAAVPEQQ